MHLSELDTNLFFWVNQGHRNPFFDLIMPYLSEFNYWKYGLLITWLLLFMVGGKKMKVTLFLLALLVGVLDYSNSFFFKHLFERPRPCNALSGVHIFWPCPRSFSFPSNHAVNIFGATFFLSYVYRTWSFFLIPAAVVVGYSRIYVGEHYPFDVLGGIFLGGLGAALFLWIHHHFLSFGRKKKQSND
jgi:undecaprenyl-diphosphatase